MSVTYLSNLATWSVESETASIISVAGLNVWSGGGGVMENQTTDTR